MHNEPLHKNWLAKYEKQYLNAVYYPQIWSFSAAEKNIILGRAHTHSLLYITAMNWNYQATRHNQGTWKFNVDCTFLYFRNTLLSR